MSTPIRVQPTFDATKYAATIHADAKSFAAADTRTNNAASRISTHITAALQSANTDLKLAIIGNDLISLSKTDEARNKVLSSYRQNMARCGKQLKLDNKPTVKISKDKKSCSFEWKAKPETNEALDLLREAAKECEKLSPDCLTTFVAAFQHYKAEHIKTMESDRDSQLNAAQAAIDAAKESDEAIEIKAQHDVIKAVATA